MDSYADYIEKEAFQRGFEIGYERECVRLVAKLVAFGIFDIESAIDLFEVPSEKRSHIRKMAEEKLANEKKTE